MFHLDLFSGIGGFHLAGEIVWGDNFRTIAHVEIDPFCQKILKKHWPQVPIISNIKEYKHDGTAIDLLTGGFPCQPFSCAGKQRGKEDDRYLWPEMLRVISEVRPTWIIGENVAGIINMELDQVLSNLENEGYTCQPFIIPACAVNAPHRRDRVWIVANRSIKNDRAYLRGKEKRQIPEFRNSIKQKDVADSTTNRLHNIRATRRIQKESLNSVNSGSTFWAKSWLEVATRLCRMDDGISSRVDRVNKLKTLGNAIVPQCVVPIMQAIKAIG